MAKQKAPLSLRLDAETEERLELAAERTKLKKHALAQMAVEAAIDAIEANDFQIVLPIRFDVKQVAAAKDRITSYAREEREERMMIEESAATPKKKAKK